MKTELMTSTKQVFDPGIEWTSLDLGDFEKNPELEKKVFDSVYFINLTLKLRSQFPNLKGAYLTPNGTLTGFQKGAVEELINYVKTINRNPHPVILIINYPRAGYLRGAFVLNLGNNGRSKASEEAEKLSKVLKKAEELFNTAGIISSFYDITDDIQDHIIFFDIDY